MNKIRGMKEERDIASAGSLAQAMLSTEIRYCIVHYVDQNTLTKLSQVDRLFSQLVQRELHVRPTLTSSAAVSAYVESFRMLKASSKHIVLTLESGSSQTEAPRSSSSRRRQRDNALQDWRIAITEEDFVQAIEHIHSLQELHMRQLHFTSLRRRSLSALTARAHTLQTLAISGPAQMNASKPESAGFNLNSVGRIVSACQNLRHLHLRNVRSSGPTLDKLGAVPPCALRSFALISSPTIKQNDLAWLLRSTCLAESLRDLALEWHDSPRPILESVRYGVLRLERLAFTTRIEGSVESLMLHCPSLQHLQFKVTGMVDPVRLLANLERPILRLEDHSEPGHGFNLLQLAVAIESGHLKFARQLERVAVCLVNTPAAHVSVLKQACLARRIDLIELPRAEEGGPLLPHE